MKKVKWTLTVLLFLVNSLYGFDMSGTIFIDYVRFVSNTSKINIVIDEDIDTKISIIMPKDFNTKDSFKILKQVLYKNDMYIVKYGTVYYIKKVDDELYYNSIKLKYLLPDKIIPIIKQYHRDVVISKSKRTIIFKSTNKAAKKIKKLISLLDKPVKSKKIKIQLISFQDNDLVKFGINLDTSIESYSYKTFIDGLTASSSLSLNLDTLTLNIFLNDLKSKSLVDFKFSPVISLFDNQKTDFKITKNIPYLSEDRSVNGTNDVASNSYDYRDVGSKIEIDKVSVTDDCVYFHIKMQYEVILDNSVTPVTSKRSIDNYIKLKNNESIMITGLRGVEKIISNKEIPFLVSIPYIGNVFKWKSHSTNKETFAIFLSNVEDDFEYKINVAADVATGKKGVPTEWGK